MALARLPLLMHGIPIKTIVLGTSGVIALALALSFEVERREYPARLAGLTPLRIPLSQQNEATLRRSFTAAWTEPHYVALVFPNNVGDLELESVIQRAESAVGSTDRDRPQFDFEWRAAEGAIEVGHGSGRVGPTGLSVARIAIAASPSDSFRRAPDISI